MITVLRFAIDKKTLWYVIVAFFRLAIASSADRHKQKTDVYSRRLVVVVAVECALLSVAERRTQRTREAA